MSKAFPPVSTTATVLSSADFDAFRAAVAEQAAPTAPLIEAMQRYRTKIASGELVTEPDCADDLNWFKAAFTKICEDRDAGMNLSFAAENRALRLLHPDFDAMPKGDRDAHHYTLMHVISALIDAGFRVDYPASATNPEEAFEEGPGDDYDGELELARGLIYDDASPTSFALEIFRRRGSDREKALAAILTPILQVELKDELAQASIAEAFVIRASALDKTLARMTTLAAEYPEGVFYALAAQPGSMSRVHEDIAALSTATSAD
jgi:hypothetical protein